MLFVAMVDDPLLEAEFDHSDLVGLRVRTSAGDVVGTVREVLWGPANDNLVVDGPAGEVLVPFIEDVILAVDLPDRTITIEPIDGLLDLNEKKK
jgi:16S rRNA processing protein RimM